MKKVSSSKRLNTAHTAHIAMRRCYQPNMCTVVVGSDTVLFGKGSAHREFTVLDDPRPNCSSGILHNRNPST